VPSGISNNGNGAGRCKVVADRCDRWKWKAAKRCFPGWDRESGPGKRRRDGGRPGAVTKEFFDTKISREECEARPEYERIYSVNQ
jgi:hypothetical protein